MSPAAPNEESIFLKAIELDSEQARQAYLDSACKGDPALRQSVEALLEAFSKVQKETDFLEPIPARTLSSEDAETSKDLPACIDEHIDRYRLLQLIGQGGFGEVYLAQQEKPVRRKVALKILKHGVVDDQVTARFESERQALANMDHPNIAKILDGGETSDGRPYFVMEYIDGEPVTTFCSRRKLEVEEIISLFIPVCQAMQYAHENGTIHRDLKPSNILIKRKDGMNEVRLIDFGIAKVVNHMMEDAPARTQQQQLLGTPAYMSPEQARGETVDHRSDIWSIAAVLFECLSGQGAFSGASSMEVIGAILHKEPDWQSLPDEIPNALLRLLEDCLHKERTQRVGSMLTVQMRLEAILHPTETEHATTTFWTATRETARKRMLQRDYGDIMIGTVVGALVVLIVFFFHNPISTPPKPADPEPKASVRMFQLPLPVDPAMAPMSPPKISPDGERIVYANHEGLWIRELASLELQKLQGTERGVKPFWGPDGLEVGYVIEGHLRRISLRQGNSFPIVNIPGYFESIAGNAAWTDSDVVLYSMLSSYSGLNAVSAGNGKQALIRLPDWKEQQYDYDHLSPLPGGRGLLCVVHSAEGMDRIVLLRPKSTTEGGLNLETHLLWIEKDATLGSPVYCADGYILFHKLGETSEIWALPFSAAEGRRTGEPFIVFENARNPSIAENNNLIFIRSRAPVRHQAVRMSREGEVLELLGQPLPGMGHLKVSPDGQQMVVCASKGLGLPKDIWMLRNQWEPLTSTEEWEWLPVWHPDSKHIFFKRDNSGRLNARLMELSVTDLSERVVWSDDSIPWLSCFAHPLKDRLLITVFNEQMEQDIWELSTNTNQTARPYLEAPENQLELAASPDGRCLAYVSEYGKDGFALMLKPLPNGPLRVIPQEKLLRNLRWNSDASELFFLDGSKLKGMQVKHDTELHYQPIEEILDLWNYHIDYWRGFDVAPDGASFYLIQQTNNAPRQTELVLIENCLQMIREQERKTDPSIEDDG